MAPFLLNELGGFMRPLKRGHVNKHSAAKSFRKQVGRTKSANVWSGPMRGGVRM